MFCLPGRLHAGQTQLCSHALRLVIQIGRLQSENCLDTADLQGLCALCLSSGVWGVGVAGCTLLPVKTGIWKVLFHPFHPATCHRLIHKVPCRPFSSPSRSCALKHGQNRQTQACISRAAWKFTWRDLRCCLLTHNQLGFFWVGCQGGLAGRLSVTFLLHHSNKKIEAYLPYQLCKCVQ